MNVFSCVLSLILLLAPAGFVAAEVVDRSVAVVNNDIITLSEVNEMGKPLFQKIAAEAPADQISEALQEARRSIIEKLIDKKILLQEAQKLQISVSDLEVDEALKRIIEANKVTKAQFSAELASLGLTEEQYRLDLHDQILSSKLVNYEVRSKVVIPEEDIIDYYDTNYTAQVEDGGYYILQIGCTWDAATSKEEARAKAERVHSLAVQGADFQELARQHSDLPSAADGGDLGVFQADEMASSMRDAVVNLTPGEISAIIETPNGFQFFKLLSSQEGQIITKVPYESVKDEIRQTLYEKEMQARYAEWIKQMRSKAYIKIL